MFTKTSMENDNMAAELAIANQKILLQSEQRDKRAAELAIANKELLFQNGEKEKRAAELAIAIKELAFQNAEKEQRAVELAIANKELAFQNEEKEKRAVELALAYTKVLFQNGEIIRAAEALKRSEFNYRQIVETALEGICLTDEHNQITFVNQKMCELFGFLRGEMIGKSLEFFKNNKAAKTPKKERKKSGHAVIETYDTAFFSKSGKLICAHVSTNPILTEDGTYKGALSMISDITEKVEAEKLLRENEKKFRQLAVQLQVESDRLIEAQAVAKVGSWQIDLQTLKLKWSKETHRIFETAAEKFNPNYDLFLEFVHPEDRAYLEASVAESIRNGTSASIEHRILTLKGTEKYILENWQIYQDENGVSVRANGTCQDITERRKAEEKLIKSEYKLNAAQRISEVGSWEIDMLNNVCGWSDEFFRIFEIQKGEVIPSDEAFLSFVHPDDAAFVTSSMRNAFATLTDSTFSFRFIKKNGEVGYGTSEWNFEFDRNKKPIRLAGILRDVTKQKKAENERSKMISDIIQRNKELEQFTYIVSHNLRAPVANIIGFTDLLGDPAYPEDVKKEFLTQLSVSVSKLDDVTKDLNNVLLVKQKVNDVKETFTISNTVQNILVSIQNLVEQYDVKVETDFSEIDRVLTIKSFLHSIFYNLISNSIKYRSPDRSPVVLIKSHKQHEGIQIVYRDNGLGIDMTKNGDEVFGLYKRFHLHIEGKGVGLFMTKSQIETLGGRIEVKSEIKKGTEFKIYLPY